MNLTKAIKEELVMDLVAEACKKHAVAMGDAATKLQSLWESLVVAEVERMIPELSRSRWLELIQKGTMVSHASNGTLNMRVYEQPEDVKNPDWRFNTSSRLVSADGPKYEQKQREAKVTFLRHVARNWKVFCRVFSCSAGYYAYEVRFDPSFPGIPAVRHVKTVFAQAVEPRNGDPVQLSEDQIRFSKAAWPLVKTAQDLAEKFATIIREAEAMKETLELIIMPMKTDRQLLDAMPEAAKFLPEPVAKKQELAPKDLVDKARRMIAEGIPT